MEPEKVAILLAVYNGERYLGDLLHSLMKQSYSDFKIYIRDNCSTDDTANVLQTWKERYPHKIELFTADSNKGCIANFAALLNLTNAPYVMFCDHDDVWLPNKIALTMQKMEQMQSIYGQAHPIVVHTDLTVVDAELNIIAPSLWKVSKLNTSESCYNFSRLLVQNQLTGCTMMLNRALIDLAKPIPPKCIMHDWWIALVASCLGSIGTVRQSTILYRQHGSNDTGAKPYDLFAYFKRKKKAKIMAHMGIEPALERSAFAMQHSIVERKIEQTELFINRYQNMLSLKDVKIALAYLKMQRATLPMALTLLLRYGFFKSGFLRNFILNH